MNELLWFFLGVGVTIFVFAALLFSWNLSDDAYYHQMEMLDKGHRRE